MKTKNKLLIFFLLIIVCIITLSFVSIHNKAKCEARYIYDNQGYCTGILYNNTIYHKWSNVSHDFVVSGAIYNNTLYPYCCVYNESQDSKINCNKVYIADDYMLSNIFLVNWFCYYSETYDKNHNFITNNSTNSLYIKEDFIFPILEKNEINEIWLSLSSSYEIINDKETVDKIVDCAKSNGEKELDKEIYDYIIENSWDNHCIYLKYEGYPLVEEFFVTETEDGRYIVDQYTAEEYDTIYYDEH